jgi:hypothetical protein
MAWPQIGFRPRCRLLAKTQSSGLKEILRNFVVRDKPESKGGVVEGTVEIWNTAGSKAFFYVSRMEVEYRNTAMHLHWSFVRRRHFQKASTKRQASGRKPRLA